MDGDSYVGAWSGGARSGWGATYWNNGNAHEGGNAGGNAGGGGAMHGQGLHFKWGDGAAFRCRTMAHCFERDALVHASQHRPLSHHHVPVHHTAANQLDIDPEDDNMMAPMMYEDE